jgi:valyl-tRNA synthetase
MGHAFEHSLIDTLVRYHRMKGRNTLWLPGTDHASIAVSAILDKQLKEEGKTRRNWERENVSRTGLAVEGRIGRYDCRSTATLGFVGGLVAGTLHDG